MKIILSGLGLLFCSHLLAQSPPSSILLAEKFHLSGDIDSVKKYATNYLNLANRVADERSEHRARYFIAAGALRAKPDSAYKLLTDLQARFEQNNDYKYLSFLYASLGSYYRRQGNFDKALFYHKKAVQVAENHLAKTDPALLPRILAGQYNSMAVVNFDRSEYEQANQLALMALKLCQEHNIAQTEGAAYLIIGNIQLHYNQLQQAQNSFLRSYELATKVNDTYRKGVALGNLGIVNLKLLEKNNKDPKAYANAIKYYNEALVIAKKQNDNQAIAARLSNLANTENTVGHYQLAQKYILQALEYAARSQSKILELQTSTTLARNYLNLGDTHRAIQTAQKALKLAKELSNEKELPALYDILEQASLAQNDFKKALDYQKLQLAAKDSVFSQNTNQKILELQSKYESEKKQRKIEQLSAENELNAVNIQRKNILITSSAFVLLSLIGAFYFWKRQHNLKAQQNQAEMQQRLLRAQLNPHFLFNCLNSIQRLYIDGQTNKANDFIADFAQLMRDILDKTSKIKIPLYEEIDFLEAYLSLEKRRMGERFDYKILIAEELKYSEIEVPSFIIQPLAENALLHGILPKNQHGNIEINVEKHAENQIDISIADDGMGFYQSLQKAGKHQSKGIELIKNRLGKNGKIEVEELKNKEGNIAGTKVKMKLKI